jgi:hypothetical protein
MARLGWRTEDLSSLLVCVCNHQGPRPGRSSWTYGEDNGDASTDRFASIQRRLFTQPQVLRLAAIALPARDRGAKQQHLDALTGGQLGNDLGAGACSDNVDLGARGAGGGRIDCGRAVRAIDHGV